MDILSIGEALIDFKQTEHLAFQGFEGGSPMNVAIAAARLGPSVGFAGQASSDMFGEALRTYLQKKRVDTQFFLEHPAPSTLAFVAEIDGDAHFSFMNNGAADTLYNPQPRPQFPDSLKFMMFGSISLLTEPTASSIIDIVALHQERCAIVLDPNVRPALIPDKAEYENKLKKWLSLAHIVKVNTQDLDWLHPEKTGAQVAESWLEYGAQALIITNGGEGVTLYRKAHEPLAVTAPKITVVDTVGAGDTFTGSMMVALFERQAFTDFSRLESQTWQEVLSYAAHAAAYNCTRAGANPPNKEELQSFIKEQG